MTVGQCYDKVRKLLNYYSAGGAPLPSREGDLWPRAAALLDTAHREFARREPGLASRVLTQRVLRNLLPEMVPFWVGEKPVNVCAEGAQSLTFATDGPLEVRVTQVLHGVTEELAAISCPAGQTQVYAAALDAADGAAVTVELTGCAYVWNIAMYDQRFADGAVPAYGEHRWQALPEDCVQVKMLNLRPLGGAVRQNFRDYRLKKGQIGLPWDFIGTATLVYECAPRAITEDTPPDTELDVDDADGEGMACYAAAWLVAEENEGLFKLLMGVYQARLGRSREQPDTQINSLYLPRSAGRLHDRRLHA